LSGNRIIDVGDQVIVHRKHNGLRQSRDRRGYASTYGPRWTSARMRTAWYAILVAVLLAFSWQSFLTQTHRHYAPNIVAPPAKVDSVRLSVPGPQSPSDLPANCPICHEIAHIGHAVLPAPILLVAPVSLTFWQAFAIVSGPELAPRSHAWRSRAPPHQLQT
jgi:hypothetical protein